MEFLDHGGTVLVCVNALLANKSFSPDRTGATIQVLLFAMLAAKLKLNSPNAHTFLEIIGARWGTAAHLIFLFFGLATNM
jgi:Na+/proline symporter